MPRNRRHLVAALALALGAVSGLAACGDDDETTTATTAVAEEVDGGTGEAAAGSEAFCDGYIDANLQLNGEPDPEALTAAIDAVDANAPGDLADSAAVLTDAVRDVLASGGQDFSSFETPEFTEAKTEVDGFTFAECPFDAAISVEGADYSFTGVPDEVPSGRVAVMFSNEGSEAHEIVLARRNDGVTDSFADLLALPEEEAMSKVTMVGGTFAPVNGSSSLLVADLEPGDYIAVCFVPVGTMMTDDGPTEGEGAPHLAHGMQQEFTVTG